MKKIIGLGLGWCCVSISLSVSAQTYAEEALLFSRISPGGSARIQAMGGAQVALGGDYSSAFSNPAGLGFYNKSEATLSLGNGFFNSTSNYFNNSTSDSKSNFNIPGFSLVLHTDKNNGKLIGGSFAISLTRTNNFNQQFTYQGTNSSNSLANSFIDDANSYQLPPSQLFYPGDANNPPGPAYYTLPWLAYNTYLIGPKSETSPTGDSTQYHTYLSGAPHLQHERVQNSGSQNQVNIAYGMNFNDFFFLGASVGIATLNYNSKKVFTESYTDNGPLSSFELDENLSVKGTGVNATLGAIIKPKDFVQFGLSISSPTYYPTLSENYTATMTANWNNYNFIDQSHPAYNTTLNGVRDSIYYDTPLLYALSTPWRLKGGVTFFIKKHGLITAEVEKVNYSNAHFSSNANTPSDFSADNTTIKTSFRNVFNLRLGGEYRISNYRVRLGYSYMPDPYNSSLRNVDNTITSVTGGVGYRSKKYFVDLGFVQTQWQSAYSPYSTATTVMWVTLKNTNTSAMVTVGMTL